MKSIHVAGAKRAKSRAGKAAREKPRGKSRAGKAAREKPRGKCRAGKAAREMPRGKSRADAQVVTANIFDVKFDWLSK